MKSKLRGPEGATTVGLLTAAGIYLIYNNALPSIADVREASPDNASAESSRKTAAWTSAALIGLVYVVSRDINSYLISGAALVAVDAMHKHANQINPHTNKVDAGTSQPLQAVHSMPDYSS